MRFKALVIVHIILILILIGLIVKIKMQEEGYHCEDCQIRFTNIISRGGDNQFEEIILENITRMYNHYVEDKCSVRFSPTFGGYTGGLINITI